MATLLEKITAPDAQPRVVEACLKLIEEEVSSKKGFSGAAVKTGYKVVKAIKPTMIRDAVVNLVPEFAKKLQPMYEASGASDGGDDAGTKFASHLSSNAEQAADAMLSVTDEKAARANNKTLKKTYERLRGSAKTHVIAAVPNIGKTLGKFC